MLAMQAGLDRQPFRNGDTLAANSLSNVQHRPTLHDFVTMPTERMLTQNDNELFMDPFSLAEVLPVTTSLSRHKAAGANELNNDFI